MLYEETDAGWTVIQAEAHGVTNDKLLSTIAPGGTYEVLPLPSVVDRVEFVDFVESQVGAKYGFITIGSCALDIVLPDIICLRKADTWICSGLVAAGLMAGGYGPAREWARKDLYTVMPSEVYQAITGG